MDQDNRNNAGAPSDDTTSALFVSARKKQLEQQEAERRAKEKENERLAAEAEVRRLEREVEERRRKTEQEAKQAEEEAKRIAEEARAKKAQAAQNPDAVLGEEHKKKEFKLPQMPKVSIPSIGDNANSAKGDKAPMSKKKLAMIGGGAAAVVLILILVLSLGGGSKETGGATTLEILEEYDIPYYIENGSEIWYGNYSDNDRIKTADHLIMACEALGEGMDGIDGNMLAQAMNDIYDTDLSPSMWRVACAAIGLDGVYYEEMLGYERKVEQQPAQEPAPAEAQKIPDVPAGYTYYENTERGLAFNYPGNWNLQVTDFSTTSAYIDPIIVSDGTQFIVIFNYTGEYADFLSSSSSNFQDFLEEFAEDTFKDLNVPTDKVNSPKFNNYDEYADGSRDQGVSFMVGDTDRGFAAIRAEANKLAFAVFAIGHNDDGRNDILNMVTTSIVVSEVE